MNFIKKLPVILALALLGLPTYSFAQYHYDCDPFFSYFKDPKRWEISMGVVLPAGQFDGVTHVATGGNYRGDTTMKRNINAQMGYGMALGLFAPFKGTGHISFWGMDVQLMVNEYIWQNLNQTYGTDNSLHNAAVSVNALTTQISLPLGVSYKVGCDAILSKRLALCAAFGAGIMPQLNYTYLEGIGGFNDGYGLGVTPYAKIDLGFFAGWCWKLRFMYSYGHVNLYDANHAIPTLTDGPFTFASTSNFMVSLVIMPFAGQWQETAWWNTYDTYNQHDRFN